MLNHTKYILLLVISLINILFSEEESQWKLRDSNSFFWDNKNKEIRNTIADKDKKISELENILVSKNLALSVKEKENEQLKNLVTEMNKEKQILARRVHIRDKEISNLKLSVKRLSHELKKNESDTEFAQNTNLSSQINPLLSSENSKTEEKIANYLISVDENIKIAPKLDINDPVKEVMAEDKTPIVENEVITKARKNTIADTLEDKKAAQQKDIVFQAASSSKQNSLTKAYLSEFFLTNMPLGEIMKNANIEVIQIDGEFNPYKMWAYSTLNRDQYPQIAAQIRSELLINAIARDRTNFDGQGHFENLKRGEYYLIGLAQIGSVGTVWEYELSFDEEPVSINLTRDNAVWYQ